MGTVTIAEAANVFVSQLDLDFKRWGTDVAGKDTGANTVGVHEVSRDGTFTSSSALSVIHNHFA
jgi:hypothetical protein